MTETAVVPKWADQWARGRCGCGARLVECDCYCGGHIVCSESGWAFDKCPKAETKPESD